MLTKIQKKLLFQQFSLPCHLYCLSRQLNCAPSLRIVFLQLCNFWPCRFDRRSSGARFTKYLTTILQLSYDVKVRSTYDGRLILKQTNIYIYIYIYIYTYRGTLRFADVMEASTSKLLTSIQDRQRHLQPDDPINIQFTSVRPSQFSFHHYSAPKSGARSRPIVMSASVCLCVFAVRDHIFGITRPIFTKFFMHVTRGRGSVLLWWPSDMLRISGFVDDVIFAHKVMGLLDVAARLRQWGSYVRCLELGA